MRVLAEIYRRPDIAPGEFRQHYETRHVPLALQSLDFARYRRLHVQAIAGQADAMPDCLSDFGYRDAAHFAAIRELLAGAAGDRLREDELRFMDKPRNQFAPLRHRQLCTAADTEINALLHLSIGAQDWQQQLNVICGQLQSLGWQAPELLLVDRELETHLPVWVPLAISEEGSVDTWWRRLQSAGIRATALAAVAACGDGCPL